MQATVYSDEGTTVLSQPFSGDSLGRFWFYAPDGDYDVQVAGTGLTTYTLSDQSVSDTKRVTTVGANERDASLLVNAFYNRNAAAWHRRDTGFAAWRVDLDVNAGTDYIRFLRVASGANPITWAESLRLTSAGHLLVNASVWIGALPALTGAIRLSNATDIKARNAANTADFRLIQGTAGGVVLIGGESDIQWGTALVALGGGATPTFGTIGGSGPTGAAQNTWMRIIDSTGAACWVPVWK